MFDLSNHIINETTTSGDIAFLPGGFEPVQQWFKKMKKTKAKWGTSIIDTPDMYEVKFENALIVRVQKEHWDEFNKHMNLKLGELNEVDLDQYIKEAKADEFGHLWSDIADAIWGIYENRDVLDTNDDVQEWLAYFDGVDMNVSKEAAMNFNTTEEDMDLLIRRIRKEYAEDYGNLQMLIDALKNKKPLRSFDVLNDYDYLIGSRIESVTPHGKMIFEAFVDLMFKPSEKIYIESESVLEELDGEAGVKVIKKNVYPVGDRFSSGFFRKIKEALRNTEE